jgi:hypothetical protein
MINFSYLENNIENFGKKFNEGVVESIIIDEFLDNDSAQKILQEFPNPIEENISKSRDYVFAKNKFEKSDIASAGPNMARLKEELLSVRFQEFLKSVTNQNVFVDPSFHGGGLHQGGENSFLDMHVDFNYHPTNNNWFRNLNILIYFNKDWKKEYGGSLKIINKNTNLSTEIEPLFNRCVIMFTRDYTLHGYDKISFPKNEFRRSIATYAYSLEDKPVNVRSTTWYPENSGFLKNFVGKKWPSLVKIKSKIFGSSTSKNK